MNSQFAPGLNEAFARQQHQQLLDESVKARLLSRAAANQKIDGREGKTSRFRITLRSKMAYAIGFTLLVLLPIANWVAAAVGTGGTGGGPFLVY